MIRPLLQKRSQTAGGYVCRSCRQHLAQQRQSRHIAAFSTTARRRLAHGELEETDQDYFGGFNDLSEQYSSSKFQKKKQENGEVKAKQEKEEVSDTFGGNSPAGLDALRAKLSQRVDREHDQDKDEGAAETEGVVRKMGGTTAFARAKPRPKHPLHGIVIPLQGQLDRKGNLKSVNSHARAKRRTLLANHGIAERRDKSADDQYFLAWRNDDGTLGERLTVTEVAAKREELAEAVSNATPSTAGVQQQSHTAAPGAESKPEGVALPENSVIGQNVNSVGEIEAPVAVSEAKTAFARAPRFKHAFHGIRVTGQRAIDRGSSASRPSTKHWRRKILADFGLIELSKSESLIAWLNEDGTVGEPLTATELAAKREEIMRTVGAQAAEAPQAAAMTEDKVRNGSESKSRASDTDVAESDNEGPSEASQRDTFEGIMAKLQAGLPNRINIFNAAKERKTSIEDDVSVPEGTVSGDVAKSDAKPEHAPDRVANPFSRPVDAVNVSSGLRHRDPGQATEPEVKPESDAIPSQQPLKRLYNFGRPSVDLEIPTLAARVRETNARNAAWGGIAPTVNSSPSVKVDADSLRAMDSVSRIIPKAAPPGQKKAWGQEPALTDTATTASTDRGRAGQSKTQQPVVALNSDNFEMMTELEKESAEHRQRAKSQNDRPNTRIDLGKSRNHTFDELKAALAQSMDGRTPEGQPLIVQKSAAKEKPEPKKQISMFRRIMDGLTGASSYSRQESGKNDDALSGHLASGQKAIEKRMEEEQSSAEAMEQPPEKPLDNAAERLAKLHGQSHAVMHTAANATTPSASGLTRETPAVDQDGNVEEDEMAESEHMNPAQTEVLSDAGQELMTIRQLVAGGLHPDHSKAVEDEKLMQRERQRIFSPGKNKRAVKRGERQMNFKEAMQQAMQQPHEKLLTPRVDEPLQNVDEEDAAFGDESEPALPTPESPVDQDEIKSILPAELSINNLNIPQPDVPPLQYGLDRVLFNPGVFQLQDPHSRVYNFDPYLQKITPIKEFDFNALKEYKTSSQDMMLSDLAQEHGKKYVGSTSSMTGTLAHFHYLLSNWRELNLDMLSRGFKESLATFTQINRAPNAIFLRWKNGTYAIDADKEYDGANVLMMLGKSMEKLLTLPREEYERYTRGSDNPVTKDEKEEPESYEYTSMGDFLMRSQLDAYDPRLPGNGTFDLKTRAVVSIRMDVEDFEPMLGYELHTLQGKYESYEREYYDMMRSTMLKYMLQARMGRMDGIFLAYHNIERMFGFQYLPISELDRAIHGQIDRCLGDQEFKVSLQMLNEVFDMATEKFPKQTLRFHFESADKPTNMMWVFAEPVTEDEADAIQSKSKAKVAEFERSVMGIEKEGEGEASAASAEESTDNATLEAESEEAAVVHPDPLSAYAAATAEPKSTPDGSDAESSDASSGSSADVKFMKKLSSNVTDHTKPLFAASIILHNYVNGQLCENNRPHNLTKSDEWRIEYILKEAVTNSQTNWARYEDLKARRRKVFERLDASLEEEGGGSSEMTEKKKPNGYLGRLRELAERGREFRTKVDKLEEGKEKVVVGMPPVKVDGGVSREGERRVVSPIPVGSGEGVVEGADEVKDVESYMNWLFRR